MNIDYEKEYISLLKENNITIMPKQNIIDNNETVAFWTWQNFTVPREEYEDFNFTTWYDKANWKTVLKSYSDNFSFWDKIFDNYLEGDNPRCLSKLFISTNFSKDFPKISEKFLSNNNNLKKLFELSHDKFFFSMLTINEEEKEAYYKEYLLKYNRYTKDDLLLYQNDLIFLEKVVEKYPSAYKYLNEKNQNNDKLIKLAIKDKETFSLIPEDKKDFFLNHFLNIHLNNLRKSDIIKFDKKIFNIILEKRLDLLDMFVTKNFETYFSKATELLLKDPTTIFDAISINPIYKITQKIQKENSGDKNIYDTNNLELFLNDFIDNFYDFSNISYINRKKIKAIKSFPHLEEKLRKNVFYQVYITYFANNYIDNNQDKRGSININDFYYICDNIIDRHNNKQTDEAISNSLISKTMTLLSIEDLKELKIPKKDTFQYIKSKRTFDLLKKSLINNSTTIKKIKI